MAVVLKRVYQPASSRDGVRVLVDRLWPRGVSKQTARLKLWLKEVAPSDELRQWYHAHPAQWPKFRERYIEELSAPETAAALDQLHELAAKSKTLTLLFGSQNLERNNATVLKELLDGMKKPPRSTGGGTATAVRKSASAR
jgi:uncharacterized protein YeaO (DUF488 family)